MNKWERRMKETLQDFSILQLMLNKENNTFEELVDIFGNVNGYDKEENYIDIYFGKRLETTVSKDLKTSKFVQATQVSMWYDNNERFVNVDLNDIDSEVKRLNETISHN